MKLDDLYVLGVDFGDGDNAGPKAPRDIVKVLLNAGAKTIRARRTHFHGVIGRQVNRLLWLVNCWWIRQRLPNDATIFMSYPNMAWSATEALCVLNAKVKRAKRLRLVTFINDLNSFHWAAAVAARSAENLAAHRLEQGEDRLCELFDKVIVHNQAMADKLERCGVPKDNLVAVEVFDYLTDVVVPNPGRKNFKRVIYAGNLNPVKSPFVADLRSVGGCDFELFGPDCPPSATGGHVRYGGVFRPDDLPRHFSGGFGLVWDGASVDTVAGPIGEYYKFIAPHKLSLYLASELPVFIWKESGEADFVLRHKVGFAVGSLVEIGETLAKLTFDDYVEMRRRVAELAAKVRSGFFTLRAVGEALG